MLVFGDQVRIRDPRFVVRELAMVLAEVATRPPGITRHAALVGAFLEAGELAQALADAETAVAGCDGRWLVSDIAMSALVGLAHDVKRSWTSGFQAAPTGVPRLAAFASVPLPSFVRMRRAEGHAFYAVYPEAYLVAAQAARAARPGPRQVIGIRSIGTGLAAIVSAALDAPLPATVRPGGDPLRRDITVTAELAAEWTPDASTTYAIVDEGPGQCGSAFGAVADALEARGVRRIECYPSHAGELGALALDRHRRRWAQLPRTVVDVDTLLVHTTSRPHMLATWIAELVGPLLAPLEDVSAGRWREARFPDEHSWPASVTYQERRKWLARSETGTWVAKFVGLGRVGERALARARTLHASRFTPEVAGLRHGFLIERWHGDARALDVRHHDRAALVEHVGRYLGFRARAFPASDRGAPLPALLDMAHRNATRSIGAPAAGRLHRWTPHLAQLERVSRAVEIDGRLHAWEWLVRPGAHDPALLKTDALDHHAAHDLVGCQDITWDVVGATYELGLSAAEEKRLSTIVGELGQRTLHPDLIALMRPCYLAFQLGRHALAIDTAAAAESVRLQTLVDRYARLLVHAI